MAGEKTEEQGLTTADALLFAAAAGVAVGNLYWTQPLLARIAENFGVQASVGGHLMTATQVGYALGILLLVPLGDMANRRKLVTTLLALCAVSLVIAAFAPHFGVLGLSLALVGFTTVSGQVILPMAGGLAAPQDRGRIVGIVTSGVVVGILFARTVNGFIANLAGWRSIYIVAAVLNIILIFALRKRIPTAPGGVRMPYPKLILSVFTEARRVKNVGPVLLIGGFGFCALQLFWTAITFLLAAPPFGYNTLEIGLVSLVGVAGALIAAKVGGLMDRGVGIPAQGCFIALGVAAMLVSSLGSHSIILVVLAALLMSLSFQGIGILNQTTLFLLAPKSRSRLNTAFVVNNFIFAAFGSTLAAVLWDYGGWVMVSLGGAASLLIALSVWACAKKNLKAATDAARGEKAE